LPSLSAHDDDKFTLLDAETRLHGSNGGFFGAYILVIVLN
jgi:hypothetical protein